MCFGKESVRFEEIARRICQETELYLIQKEQFFPEKKIRSILYPSVRRVSAMLQLLSRVVPQIAAGKLPARGLEIGVGFGSLLFSSAVAFPQIDWEGLEHPKREYLNHPQYQAFFKKYNCKLQLSNIVLAPLPYADNYFSLITFSEVLEHISPDKVLDIIKEIQRILCPGGWLIVSSPNLVSLSNRIRLLIGKNIFESVEPVAHKGYIYGHLRLYTAQEFIAWAKSAGFALRRIRYKSTFARGLGKTRLILHKLLQAVGCLLTDRVADTWYIVLQKDKNCHKIGN